MSPAIYFLAGGLLAAAVLDLLFACRIYALFPQQSRRFWPGSGVWMAWKCVLITRNSRNRLMTLHALASTINCSTIHRDETRAFVSAVKKFTDVGAPVEIRPEFVAEPPKPEAKP